MSYGQQGSESRESRGLMPAQREYFSGLAPGIFDEARGFSRAAALDPAGLEYLPAVERMLPTGRYGLPSNVDAGVFQLGRDLFSGASGARALRGFGTPASLEGVAGDALRMASGQLAPLMTQYALQRAAITPQLRQMAFGFQMTPSQILSNLLAATGQSQSDSSGFGFNLSGPVAEGGMKGITALATSDRRLKSQIIRIGTHPLGIGWYEYVIDGRREQGVMADEVLTVKPEAVHTRPDGYMMVDYSMIGRI